MSRSQAGLFASTELFLPVTGAWWAYLGQTDSVAELPVPADLPVHAVADGRVVAVERTTVGEVVVRSGDVFCHYRRLRSSSVAIRRDDVVVAGQVLGVVAEAADESQPKLIFGLRDHEERWLDPFRALVTAIDPAELRLPPPSTGHDDNPLTRHLPRPSRRVGSRPQAGRSRPEVSMRQPSSEPEQSHQPDVAGISASADATVEPVPAPFATSSAGNDHGADEEVDAMAVAPRSSAGTEGDAGRPDPLTTGSVPALADAGATSDGVTGAEVVADADSDTDDGAGRDLEGETERAADEVPEAVDPIDQLVARPTRRNR